jgi:hypothetical protein
LEAKTELGPANAKQYDSSDQLNLNGFVRISEPPVGVTCSGAKLDSKAAENNNNNKSRCTAYSHDGHRLTKIAW